MYMKKIVVFLLCSLMVLNSIPLFAFAENNTSPPENLIEENNEEEEFPVFDEEPSFYCKKEEHSHNDDCYTVFPVLSCEENHIHGESCFSKYKFLDCTIEEHIHNKNCEDKNYKEPKEVELTEEEKSAQEILHHAINEENNLYISCEKDEHNHTKECFKEYDLLNCKENHKHNEECYVGASEIICEKEEHTHTLDCVSEKEIEEEIKAEEIIVEESNVIEETKEENIVEEEKNTTEEVQEELTNYDKSELKKDFEADSFVTLLESNNKLLSDKELEDGTLNNIDLMFRSALPQDDITPTPLPVTSDGISIEKATMRWLSKSTGSNIPAKFDDLNLVPSGNTVPNQQWQLDFALSGKGFIEPGDLEITIPAYIWKGRDGNEPGRLTLATPEEPNADSYGFTWKRVDDTYVITNVKKISAGEKYMIQGTYRMTYPDPNSDKPFTTTYAHQMVDINTTDEDAEYKGISDWLYADILVITPQHQEEINARTNAVRATIDTKVEVTSCEKKVAKDSDIYISTVPNIPSLLPDNPEDYYYVRWYIAGKANGNQPYTLTLRDELTDSYNGILLGFTNGTNQVINDRDGSTDVYTGSSFDSTKSTYAWTAYPKSSFPEPNTVYTVTNKVTAEVRGVDDKILTVKEATAQASLRTPTTYYIDKVWEYNDDKYDTDLETIKERRPDSISVGISGSGFSDTLSDNNEWHTEFLEDRGRYYSLGDAWESGYSNSDYTNSARVYNIDGSYYYTRTGWRWYNRRKAFDSSTNTWTFYNAYEEVSEGYSGRTHNSYYNKYATNHTNNAQRATTDKDLVLLRNNQETTDITYNVNRSTSLVSYTSNGSYSNPDNLHQKTVRLEIVDHTEYLKNRKLTEDEYYFTFATLINPTTYLWNGSDRGYGNSSKIEAEMWGKVENEWVKFGEIDTNGNITVFNSATKDGNKILFPNNNVIQTKLIARTNADWVSTSYDVGVRIKPSERVVEQVEDEFALTDYVMMTSKNDVTFNIYNDENDTILNTVSDSDTTYLHGRNYRLAVDLDKNTTFTKNDKQNRQLWFKNTIALNRVSTINNQSEFNYAVSENMFADSDSGVFYDLLPAGMRVDESSIKATQNVSIQNINIIENYKDSGRQLLVINANLVDKASRITVSSNSDKYRDETYPAYRNETVWGWEPSIIIFNMTYSYDEAQNRGLTGLRNHSAYIADEEQFGNLKYWSGEKDIPNGNNHKETLNEVRDDVRSLMTNLSPSNSPNTVYAGANISMTEVDFSALTSIVKQVSITGSDNWTFGLENEVNVPEGGKYSYRITLTSGTDTTTKDIIILDAIEAYTPIKVTDAGSSNIPVGKIISQRELEETNELIELQGGDPIQGEPAWKWKGYFKGIDISEITAMGVDAKVYYSITQNLNITRYNPEGEGDVIPEILESDEWSLTLPDDLSTVTGIAIDCRKNINGEDFLLQEDESLIAYIHMKAPTYAEIPEAFGEDYKDYLQNAHTFNNVFMDITQRDDMGMTTHSYDHFDFTQVGIYGMDIKVKKVWDDTNDNDKIRPNDLEVELVADGIDTGRKLTLTKDDNWEGLFEHVLEFNDNGDRINYTIKENVDNYTSSYKKEMNGNLTTITVTNKHELFKTSYPFTKTWTSEEPEGWEVNIPKSIQVKLFADGVFTGKMQTIKPNGEGNWSGEFTNLQKYKDGEEIVYSIEEVPVSTDWIIEYEGNEIKNTYYPYGDLIVKKEVINSTPESKDNLFKFTLSLKDKEDNDLIGEFNYIITDENNEEMSSGEIKNGDEFELKENWKIEVKDIPSGSRYSIEEENKAGYILTSKTNISNTIDTSKPQESVFTNTYNTTGSISLTGDKTLTGRDITRNQFRFEIYEGEKLLRTAGNTAEGLINFGTFTYDVNDNGKEFIYTAKEIDRGRAGYTYDDTIYTIKVYPVDNGDGTMTVTKKIYKNDEEVDIIEFNNEYHANGEVVLRAWKELEGGKLSNYGPFEFELLDEDGNIIQTKECDNDGSIVFDAISFNESHVGNIYHYTVREKSGNNDAVIYDKSTAIYEVQIIDKGDGTLYCIQSTIGADYLYTYEYDYISEGYDYDNLPFETGEAGYYDENNRWTPLPYDWQYVYYNGKNYIAIDVKDETTLISEEFDPVTETTTELYHFKGVAQCLRVDIYQNMVRGIPIDTYSPIIFKNKLKDGSLSIQKTTENDENANPNQEFKFKIKLIGEDIENKSYDIEREMLPYNAYLTYDANGGEFSNGETQNKFTYIVKNGNSTLTDGEYEEPTREGYTFEGWYEDEEFSTEFTSSPEELSLTENKIVHGKWEEVPGPKYAVSVYGIEIDKGINDETLGITFGPAFGDAYITKEKPAHIDLKDETENNMCIHNHTWEEIIEQNYINPRSFSGCISNKCTKTVRLNLNDSIKGLLTEANMLKVRGDGVSVLYDELNNVSKIYNNAMPHGVGGWGISNIRAYLNGIDSDNSDGIITATNTHAFQNNITESEALISAFPIELQRNIALRKTKYDSKYNSPNDITYLMTTYDKLWLLSSNEIFISDEVPDNYQHYLENVDTDTGIYPIFPTQKSDCLSFITNAYKNNNGSPETQSFWTRSAYRTYYEYIVVISTYNNYLSYTRGREVWGVSPCFTLRGRGQSTQNNISEPQNNTGDVTNNPTRALLDMPNQVKDALRNAQTSVEFTNGEAEVILKKNEKITINNIPAGTAYQIYEETPDGWVLVEQRNASGEIKPLETSEAEFKNRYQPGVTSVQFNGSKFLDNRPAEENSFSFELWEGDNLLETKSVLDGGFIQFSTISYTEAGTHHYTIKEVNPNGNTIDYDTHEENITVEIIDNGDGTLYSSVSYDEDGIIFRNNNRPGILEIKKNAKTTSANRDDEFTFEIEFTNENGVPLSNDENIYWYKKDADGNMIQSRNPLMRGLSKLSGDEELGLEKNKSEIRDTEIEEDKDVPKLGNTKSVEDGEDPYENQPDDIVQWTELRTGNVKYRISVDGVLYLSSCDGGIGELSKDNAVSSSSETNIYNSGYNYNALSFKTYKFAWYNYSSQITKVVICDSILLNGIKTTTANNYRTYYTYHYPDLFGGIGNTSGVSIEGFNNIIWGNYMDPYYSYRISASDTRIYRFLPNFSSIYTFSTATDSGENNGYRGQSAYIFNNTLQEICVQSPSASIVSNSFYSSSSVHTSGKYTGYWVLKNNPSLYLSPYNLVERINSDSANGIWVREVANIYFDARGGEYISDSKARVYATGESITIRTPDFQSVYRPNYILKGWARDAISSMVNYQPNKNISWNNTIRTLYAVWEYDGKNQINVNHYQETVDGGDYTLVDTDIIRDTPGIEYSPELKSYEGFHAISSVETVIVDDEELVTVNYYYDRNRYNIKFDGNGNETGQMFDNISAVGGISTKLPKCKYGKKGSIFTGWNTEPDGTGITYLDEAEVVNIGNHGETITLYAQWGDNNNIITPTNGKILVKCKAGETIVIPDLPYGTKYTIKEVDMPDGWSFESSEGEVGSISANTVSSSQFNNRYSAEGIAYITAHKRMAGDTPQDGQFTFELYQGNTLLQSKTNRSVDTNEEIVGNNDENSPNPWINTAPVEFDALHFTQDDIGKTFTYIIKEINTGDSRINYDTHTETVRITVSDAGGGNLNCNVVYDADGALFTNTLKDGTLKLGKNIVNATETAKDSEFNFTINLKDSNGNVLNGEYPVKIKHKDYGFYNVEVPDVYYSHTANVDDSGKQNGNYANNLNTNNVVNITEASNLQVDIYYNGESISYDWLSVWKGNYPNYRASSNTTSTGYVTTSDGAPNNSNKFGGSQSGSHKVNSNSLTNMGYTRLSISGNSVTFGFKSDSSGVGKGYGYYAVITPLNEEGNPLTHTEQEEQGFSETTVSNNEVLTIKGNEELEITGLPDGATYEIIEEEKSGWTLTNSSGNEGSITAGETSFAEFENTYSTSGEFTPTAHKTLLGGNLSEETFEFMITDENGNEISRATTDNEGNITFDTIHYEQEDDGKTYAYYIKEVIDTEKEDIKWDEHLSEIVVKVEDNGEGELIATPTITNNDSEFTNVKLYNIEVDKTVIGNMGDKTKDFTFTLLFNEEVSGVTYEKHMGEEVLTGDIELTNNAYEFTLKDSEKVIFNHVPYNTVYTITENDYSEEGYETRIDGSVGREVENTLTENKKHNYINTKDVTVPTRVTNNPNNYIIIIIALIVAILIIFNYKKRLKKS